MSPDSWHYCPPNGIQQVFQSRGQLAVECVMAWGIVRAPLPRNWNSGRGRRFSSDSALGSLRHLSLEQCLRALPQLHVVQAAVEFAAAHQVVVRAQIDDAAGVHH
jgi:hypothetical protein